MVGNSKYFSWDIEQDKKIEFENKSSESKSHHFIYEYMLKSHFSPMFEKKVINRISSFQRFGYLPLLNLSSNSVILDLGIGWGNFLVNVAPFVRHIYGADIDNFYLFITKKRCEDNRIKNYSLIRLNLSNAVLPFRDEVFDIVNLNGVLEWAGLYNEKASPYEIQLNLLREIARILKPDGILYIGIENRVSYKYFLGLPEGHIKMKYGSLLPRFFTRWYLKNFRKKTFRVYTYSKRGYENILRRAKFSQISFYIPWLSYSLISSLRAYQDNFAQDKLQLRGIFKFFSPSFSIIASKNARGNEGIKGGILRFLSTKLNREFKQSSPMYITSTGKAWMEVSNNKKEVYILKIAFSRFSSIGIKNNICLENELRLRKYFNAPAIVMSGIYKGFDYVLEEKMEGHNLNLHNAEKVYEIESLLKEFCKKHITIGEENRIINELNSKIDIICDYLHPEYHKSIIYKMRIVGEKLAEIIEKCKFNYLIENHCDFVPNNFIINNDRRKFSLIDWDFAKKTSILGIDIICWINRKYREKFRICEQKEKFPEYPKEYLEGELKKELISYIPKLVSKDEKNLFMIILSWWINHMVDWYEIKKFDKNWIDFAIIPKVEVFYSYLSRL